MISERLIFVFREILMDQGVDSEKIIKKSNAITMAKWQPESIWEPRIVALVASKVSATDKDFLLYKIHVNDLLGEGGSTISISQYQQIVKSITRLRKATIRISDGKSYNFRQYSIFSMCGYENGYLIAQFHPDLKPHFLNLSSQFTAYKLFEYLALPSIYSQRLFELLHSWSAKKVINLPLSEMHELLSTPEFMRKNFKDFRVRVIERAQKDIKEKTNLNFEWEPVKQGKSVVSIRFFLLEKKKSTES